jgi:hypothetical protein
MKRFTKESVRGRAAREYGPAMDQLGLEPHPGRKGGMRPRLPSQQKLSASVSVCQRLPACQMRDVVLIRDGIIQ